MAKDYDVLNGMIENQSTVLQTAFDKGYKQGYEEGFSKKLAQVREEEYKKGYEARKAEESNSAKMIVNCDSDAYKKGLVDAWKCAKNVCEVFSSDRLLEILEILGIEKGSFEYPASEVLSKIKEYEDSQKCERCIRQYRNICNGCVDLSEFTNKEEYTDSQKDEIKVGDEVIIPRLTYKGKAIVTKIDKEHHCAYIMFDDGEVNTFNLYDYIVKKTGRHYYSIIPILNSLKGAEDEEN